VTGYGLKLWLIYKKDFLTELRTADSLLSTIIFGIMLVVIFSFAFQLTDVAVDKAFAAVLWISIFFTSTLSLQRSFANEKENDTISALLLAVGDRGCVFLAKVLANLTTLVLLAAVIVPLAWILIDVQAAGPNHFGLLLLSLLLGSWGLAAVGTLINGITVQLAGTRLLFPLLLFPLLVPVLIGSILSSTAAIQQTGASMWGWIYLLLCFDLIYTVVPLILFDYVLEG